MNDADLRIHCNQYASSSGSFVNLTYIFAPLGFLCSICKCCMRLFNNSNNNNSNNNNDNSNNNNLLSLNCQQYNYNPWH